MIRTFRQSCGKFMTRVEISYLNSHTFSRDNTAQLVEGDQNNYHDFVFVRVRSVPKSKKGGWLMPSGRACAFDILWCRQYRIIDA